MNINEVEKRTGITKQNIRFYEKEGLIKPARSSMNRYREYTREDVRTLQIIKMLRKLDMPISDIHRILTKEVPLDQAVLKHLEVLRGKKHELEASISICKSLSDVSLDAIDAEEVLMRMEEKEKQGGIFASIANDYRRIEKEEAMKAFAFTPDSMVMNSEEFADALMVYAKENNLNLVITKPGMYPVFEMDGVEYTAERIFRRFGAEICCSMTHPEMAEDVGISKRKRKFYSFLYKYMIVFIFVAYFALTRRSVGAAIILSVTILPPIIWGLGLTGRRRG